MYSFKDSFFKVREASYNSTCTINGGVPLPHDGIIILHTNWETNTQHKKLTNMYVKKSIHISLYLKYVFNNDTLIQYHRECF